MYKVELLEEAERDLEFFEKSGQKIKLKKALAIINSISETPYTGIGKPEALKHNLSGYYSRRIDREHRIIYKIDEGKKLIKIISLKGHY